MDVVYPAGPVEDDLPRVGVVPLDTVGRSNCPNYIEGHEARAADDGDYSRGDYDPPGTAERIDPGEGTHMRFIGFIGRQAYFLARSLHWSRNIHSIWPHCVLPGNID